MTVARTASLEEAFGLLKQHENAIAHVQNSIHRVERDIFGELHAETRNMSCALESALEERKIDVAGITIPENIGAITPHSLITQRDKVKDAIGKTISEYTTQSSVRECLETIHYRLSGGATEKLDILCSAVLSDQ